MSRENNRRTFTPKRWSLPGDSAPSVESNSRVTVVDVRTPVQNRLRRLQAHLKTEQAAKGGAATTTTPTSQPMTMSPSPPKHQLKRRSDHIDVQVAKRTRMMDKSPSPTKRLSGRTFANRHSLPKAQEPMSYENDIEMTDATIQEEISCLRENNSAAADYSLSMTCTEDNKLVIKYQDNGKASAVQNRLLAKQIDPEALQIIVDTNVLIKDLSVIPKLLARKFAGGLGQPVVIIPYIVLKELENLAHTKKGTPIAQSAQMANKYINTQLQARNPRLKGQNSTDHARRLIEIESGDDLVLNCCLQVKHAGKNKRVILLSNDVNLRNKALFNEIPSFSISAIEAPNLIMDFTEL